MHVAPRNIMKCKKHGMVEHAWYKDLKLGGNGRWRCRVCYREYDRARRGGKPMSENTECSMWLGVHIAERALSRFFDTIERLPSSSPGGDFKCGKGFLIDVKSACLHIPINGEIPHLKFHIDRNTIADYFLCLAFDNRESLEPIHVWLIPGKKINHLTGLTISMGKKSLAKWSQYERSLDKVITCCNAMKEGVKA